jgi:hypothetical protein
VTCPTCERLGHMCVYCGALCRCSAGLCSCDCHVADRAREAEIQAERLARVKL